MEMRLIGDLIDHPRDLTGAVAEQLDSLAQGRFVSEVFGREGPGDDQTVGLYERGMGVAFQKGKGKDLEEIGVDGYKLLLLKLAAAVLDELVTLPGEPGKGFDIRIVGGHPRTYGDVDHGIGGRRSA